MAYCDGNGCNGVLGKNVIIYIQDGSVWRLYACATSCSISVSTSTVETSTTGSGAWVTIAAQKHSWIATLEGVVNFDTQAVFNLYDLRLRQIAMTPLLIRYERTDDAGNNYTDQGTAFIVSSSDTGRMDDVATFSIELQGSGELVPYFNENLGIFDSTFDHTFN